MTTRRIGLVLAGASLIAMSFMVSSAVATHDHPQSATPIHIAFVPNFRQTISTTQCSARGGAPSTHGAPLALASCNPPALAAGTQAHAGVKAVGGADITVVSGDTDPTNGDGADVTLVGSATDVRGGSATGPDYDPNPSGADVTSLSKIRISDHFNTTGAMACSSTTSCPGTVMDLDFTVPTACTATADPTIGSTCAVSTSADTVIPDVTKENKNSVVQIFRIRVKDSGANGVPGDTDDRDATMQGIYIP
jgi:hypothetical protein